MKYRPWIVKQGVTVGAMDAWFGNSEAVRRKHYASTKDLSEARRLFSGSWNVDSSSCSVHSETAHSSPSRPTSEKPFDTEEGKTLDYAKEKLLQAGEGS